MHAIIVVKPAGQLVDDRLGVRSWADAGVVALQRSDKRLGHAIALRAFDRRRARCEANVAGEAAGVVGGVAAAVIGEPLNGVRQLVHLAEAMLDANDH